MFRRSLLVLQLLLICQLLSAQTVVSRMRLGNNTEGAAFVRAGPMASTVAILDGYDVLGFPAEGRGQAPAKKLFDTRALALSISARGMAYIDSERLFVFDDPRQPTTLFLSDFRGRPQGTINVHYPDGYRPNHMEGMTWLPPEAPYGSNLVVSAIRWQNPTDSRLLIISRDGQVVKEIIPQVDLPDPGDDIVAVSYCAPDRLLLTIGYVGNEMLEINFSGDVVAGPVPLAVGAEGAVVLPSGRIAITSGQFGKLLFYDAGLNPLPADTRDYRIGLGLSQSSLSAWDPDSSEHLIEYLDPSTGTPQISAVNPALTAAHSAVYLDPNEAFGRLTYMPDEHLVAVTVPYAIALFRDGVPVEVVPLTVRGGALAYVPGSKQFVVGAYSPLKLAFVTRQGSVDHTIDLGATGIKQVSGLAYFDSADSGGRLYVVDHITHTATIVDLNGNLISQFNTMSAFGLLMPTGISAITSGPQAGDFAIVDTGDSEIVVFHP